MYSMHYYDVFSKGVAFIIALIVALETQFVYALPRALSHFNNDL
jgi:hypothetical protein